MAKSKVKEVKKMTLEEYEQKYPNNENSKRARTFINLLLITIAIIIIVALFFLNIRVYELHEIAGYVTTGLSLIVFIFFYLIPVIKLARTKSFVTRVSGQEDARRAKRYNKALRAEIADKMLDLSLKTKVDGWYSKDNIESLAYARSRRDDKAVMVILKKMYEGDVKKAANKVIWNAAVKVGLTTGASQSEALDTLFVIIFQMNLIKDIVYLYGFRPTESQMAKIYKNVLLNSVAAYGLNNVSSGVGSLVANSIGTVPFVGSLISSGIQVITNGALTIIVGNQTKKYLVREFKLQEALDDIDLLEEIEKEEAEMLEAASKELKKEMKKKKTPVTA